MKFYYYHYLLLFLLMWLINQPLITAQTLQDAQSAMLEQRYETAKQILEELEQEDATAKNQIDFWFLRGKIYAYIASDIRGTFTGQDTVALFRAYQSFQKAKTLVTETNQDTLRTEIEYADSIQIGLDSLHSTAINIAGNYYKQGYKITKEEGSTSDNRTNSLYKVAFEAAELAKKLNYTDTLSHSIATYSAFLRQDYPNYIRTMKEMIGVLEDKTIKYERYENLIATCRDIISDEKETLNILALALEDFPNDEKFLQARIELNEQMGTNDEKLLEDAKSQLAINPNDPTNYFNLAIVYQRLNKTQEAIDNYLACINLDPSNFTAIFNVAGIYYNKGIGQLQYISKMTFTEYQKEGRKMEEEANIHFKEAMQYFEMLYLLDKKNVVVLKSLQQIYTRLKMSKEAKAMEEMLASISTD